MIREHPRGAGPLVGAQMRYLIQSAHGWLGGFGFCASALQLKDRDQWIGWNTQTRCKNLHRVINLSRFLLRSSLRCNNLASCVLGMSLRIIAEDFELHYAYRPLLVESFVDTTHHTGACYKASNWIEVGRTQGRGRQDRTHQHEETVKSIYIYPLENDFRNEIGIEVLKRVPLDIADGLDGDQRAQHEFSDVKFGDKRLNKRLIDSAKIKGENPMQAFCGASKGD